MKLLSQRSFSAGGYITALSTWHKGIRRQIFKNACDIIQDDIMKIDPRQLQKMMQQMGIKSSEIPVKRVIIEKEEEKIVIENPSVTAIEQGGATSYQIAGGTVEVVANIPADDIKLVAEQTGVSTDECEKALIETKGDVAEAIMKLKKE
jgi:nascent polypeptide-associated complex subunit alpha